jgi:hypothetical protein
LIGVEREQECGKIARRECREEITCCSQEKARGEG